jgi:hypothetical protein
MVELDLLILLWHLTVGTHVVTNNFLFFGFWNFFLPRRSLEATTFE